VDWFINPRHQNTAEAIDRADRPGPTVSVSAGEGNRPADRRRASYQTRSSAAGGLPRGRRWGGMA
jgi:hypothetical protein